MKYGKCYAGKNGWMTCIICDGRIHDTGCTCKRDPSKDCCPARHRAQGKPEDSAQTR